MNLGTLCRVSQKLDGICTTWLAVTPFYYSVVTFTTLGFGDITPTSSWAQAVVMLEVILGYFTLGLLISILADKVARRA